MYPLTCLLLRAVTVNSRRKQTMFMKQNHHLWKNMFASVMWLFASALKCPWKHGELDLAGARFLERLMERFSMRFTTWDLKTVTTHSRLFPGFICLLVIRFLNFARDLWWWSHLQESLECLVMLWTLEWASEWTTVVLIHHNSSWSIIHLFALSCSVYSSSHLVLHCIISFNKLSLPLVSWHRVSFAQSLTAHRVDTLPHCSFGEQFLFWLVQWKWRI